MATPSVSKSHKWFHSLRLPSKSKPKPKSQTPPSLPTAMMEDKLQQVFQHLDANGDGKISGDELHAYFASIGESMTLSEAQSVIAEFDENGDELLEFEEFVKLMEREGEADEEDLKRAFEMFEGDRGCGWITPKGLQRMLNRLGDSKSYHECAFMIRAFDLDGNGVIDFHEFRHMMTSN